MLLEINFTLVLFAISFLIFIYLLNLTLYKPVGKVIEDRKNLISGNYTKAKEYTQSANEMLDRYKSEIKQARHEAQTIIEDEILKAQKIKEKKISDLLEILRIEKENSTKQLRKDKETAIKQLKDKINPLCELITNKVLGMEGKTLARSR